MSAREELLKQMVAEFPDSPMALFSLGSYYLEQEQYRDAAQMLERATGVQPDYAAAFVALGEARVAMGEPDAARAAFTRARECAASQGHQGLAEEIDEKLKELVNRVAR